MPTQGPTSIRRRVLPGALLVLAVAVAGCGSNAVSGDTVASTLQPQLEQRGIQVSDFECEDLEAEVGATTMCEATAGGQEQELTVRANRVDGDRVGYEITQVR